MGIVFNCIRGFTSACLTVNPETAGGAFGYAKIGPFRGAQAELLRVPFADLNCTKLPGTARDQWEDDFVLLADIFPTGHLGVIGVFMSDDPGATDEHARKGEYMLPFGMLWEKGMSVGTGQTPVKEIHEMLRDIIIGGPASPSFIVSHRISFDEVPEADKQFDERANGYTKVIIKP